MITNEIAHVAFSNFGDFALPSNKHVPKYFLDIFHAFHNNLLLAIGDMQMKECIMIDDVFIYHAQNLFIWYFVCDGTNIIMSTSIEHTIGHDDL